MERMVVGVDGSQGARDALQWAVNEGRRRNAVVGYHPRGLVAGTRRPTAVTPGWSSDVPP